MAYSPLYHTGNGVTTDYNVSWEYLDPDFVKVLVNGAEVAFTWVSSTVIRCSVAPANGARVAIVRRTSGTPITEWGAGVTILGDDLNLSTKQALHLAEESQAIVDTALAGSDSVANVFDAEDKRIINLDVGVDPYDAVNKMQMDAEITALDLALSDEEAARIAADNLETATRITADSVEAAARIAGDAAEAAARIAGDAATLASANAYTDTREAAILAEMAADAAAAEAAKNTAVTKASEASASATAAATSANAAAASAASAAASVVAAASSFDSFDDRYLGQKNADPALDNDGNALVAGAMYFNTGISKMKVYNGVGWQLAYNDTVSASAIPNDSAVSGANVAAALDALNTGLSGKAATSHTHVINDVTGLQAALDGKAASSHTHAQSDITGLVTALAGKASTAGNTFSANQEISASNPQFLLRKAGSGSYADIVALAGANLRWVMRFGDTTAESGSNAGSDFHLYRYADNGAYLGLVLSISRATGAFLINGANAATEGRENVFSQNQWIGKANPYLYLSKTAAGQDMSIAGTVNGTLRWRIDPGDSTAESGSNAGSDFSIHRYSDAGSYLGTSFNIRRSDGRVQINGSNAATEGRQNEFVNANVFTNTVNQALSAVNGTTGLEARGNGAGAAYMTFHRPGSYALALGLDTDNVMKIGGWSFGTPQVLIHAGNIGSYALASYFESSEQAMSGGSNASIAHGLGSRPRVVGAFLKCLTAEGGWAVGDHIALNSIEMYNSGSFMVAANSTHIKYAVRSNFQLGNASGSGLFTPSSANWRLILYAVK